MLRSEKKTAFGENTNREKQFKQDPKLAHFGKAVGRDHADFIFMKISAKGKLESPTKLDKKSVINYESISEKDIKKESGRILLEGRKI